MSGTEIVTIHGLGATPLVVWHQVQNDYCSTTLPGHGLDPWTGDYTLSALATHVARQLSPDTPKLLVGHSLGGAVAVELASGHYGIAVVGVVGVGIKVSWSDADVAGMAKVAAKGIRWFDTRIEAVERFLLQAGLVGLVAPDHSALFEAVVEGGSEHDTRQRGKVEPAEVGKWRVAQDPRTFAQQKLDMAGLLAAARCPVILGAGADDGMVSEANLAELVPDPRIAPGAGHNVHVEAPEWVASLVDELL